MRSGFLAVRLKRHEFVQIHTKAGPIKITVYRHGKSSTELAIRAPKHIVITRDKLLAAKGGEA
jgi:sRNA-binding carbon storage regulator CsrA